MTGGVIRTGDIRDVKKKNTKDNRKTQQEDASAKPRREISEENKTINTVSLEVCLQKYEKIYFNCISHLVWCFLTSTLDRYLLAFLRTILGIS